MNTACTSAELLSFHLVPLFGADQRLIQAVRRLNLGVLPVQCPDFCYKRAQRDAKQLSYAAIVRQGDGDSHAENVVGAVLAEAEGNVVAVRTLAVEIRFRRQGLARMLMHRVIEVAQALHSKPCSPCSNEVHRGTTKASAKLPSRTMDGCAPLILQLHVHVANSDAIAFYETLGMIRANVIENYYRHLEPRSCYLYQMEL